eukprot:jgi/Chlat1/8322/Chrsp8S08101
MVLHPPCKWAERSDKIYFTIDIADATDVSANFPNDHSLYFKGRGGTDNQDYELSVELKKQIDPEKSQWAVHTRGIVFVLAKKEPGYWEGLLPPGEKAAWLKVDWDKWVDEDEEESATSPNFEGMDFSSLGDFGGMGGGDDKDSDDEELPSLEKDEDNTEEANKDKEEEEEQKAAQ